MVRLRSEWAWLKYLVAEFFIDTLPRAVANALPRRVVYFATVRAWVFSLSGKHGYLEPTEVHTSETVRRWDEEDH